jgi:hypothetical protein
MSKESKAYIVLIVMINAMEKVCDIRNNIRLFNQLCGHIPNLGDSHRLRKVRENQIRSLLKTIDFLSLCG